MTIRNVGTNITSHATTNAAGLYFITNLPAGAYELTVEKSGFRTAKVERIPLTTGLAATQDVTLEVGTVQQALEVNASAVQLEAQSSDMNSVVTTRAVAELPILARDPLAFQRHGSHNVHSHPGAAVECGRHRAHHDVAGSAAVSPSRTAC